MRRAFLQVPSLAEDLALPVEREKPPLSVVLSALLDSYGFSIAGGAQ